MHTYKFVCKTNEKREVNKIRSTPKYVHVCRMWCFGSRALWCPAHRMYRMQNTIKYFSGWRRSDRKKSAVINKLLYTQHWIWARFLCLWTNSRVHRIDLKRHNNKWKFISNSFSIYSEGRMHNIHFPIKCNPSNCAIYNYIYSSRHNRMRNNNQIN